MKILLTAVNAKYIHSNLAVYSLKTYAKKYAGNIEVAEYTINHYSHFIISSIYKKRPDVLAFSCYIWNISLVMEVARELHKVLPHIKIWLGGPEVSYDIDKGPLKEPFIDGIMIGEGEAVFLELMDYYIGNQGELEDIKGVAYKKTAFLTSIDQEENPVFHGLSREDCNSQVNQYNTQEKAKKYIFRTGERELLELSKIPFPYDTIEEFENKILYYETSRGCPFSCSYCLSSIDKTVRLRPMDLVKEELELFLSKKVPQVKFVDRTFNCNSKHAMEIWQFLRDRDNGITNFHFEISGDLLNEEELKLLNTLRPGLIQLEIGVQSTNTDTIKAIHRKMNWKKLVNGVQRVQDGNNIHQHLDLIGGLPYEDYFSFRNSFNDVYACKPNQLQLGFLKVLKGSNMYWDAEKYNIVYQSIPPYEVLYTNWLSYDEILKLKQVEDMLEVYYNSGQFYYTITYLEHFHKTPFDLYESLGAYYEKEGLFEVGHSRLERYYNLLSYCREIVDLPLDVLKEIMIYDLYLRENLKSRPEFGSDLKEYKEEIWKFYQDEKTLRKYLPGYERYHTKQISRLTHLEHFSCNIIKTAETGVKINIENFVLFDYQHRNPLNYEARVVFILQ